MTARQLSRVVDEPLPTRRVFAANTFAALVSMVLLSAPAGAWACSCWGTASIHETMATSPVLVEGRVLDVRPTHTTLQVTKVLKGSVTEGTIEVGDSLCYQSLDTSQMQVQQTYVLPLLAPTASPFDLPRDSGLVATIEPPAGSYLMRGCADSGWLLKDGSLYTFEFTQDGQRRLQFFGAYASFLRWRPLTETMTALRLVLMASVGIGARSIGPIAALVVLFGTFIACVVAFARLAPELRRRSIVLIVALPLLWGLVALWGVLFRTFAAPVEVPSLEDVGWQSYPPIVGVILLLSFAAIHICRLPAAWTFSAPYSLLNGYFAVTLCFIAEAAINGVAL